MPNPVTARSQAWVLLLLACWHCGFKSRQGHGCLSRVVTYRSLRRADHSSKGVLPTVVCLSVIVDTHRGGPGQLGLSSHEKKKSVCTECTVNNDELEGMFVTTVCKD